MTVGWSTSILILWLLGFSGSVFGMTPATPQSDEKIDRSLAIFNRAKQFHRDGRLKEAIAEYENALELDDQNPWIYNALGLAMTEHGDYKDAERAFRKALDLNQELTDVHNNLGVLYSEMGRTELALKEFTLVIRDPSYPTPEKALFNMGELSMRQEDYELALLYFRRAVEKDSRFALGYRGLGQAHLAMEEPELAREKFKKAIDLAPDDVPSLYELARLYDRDGKQDKAREYYRRVVEIDRFSTLGKLSLARLDFLEPS